MKKPRTIKNEDMKKILLHLNEQDKLIFRISVETGLRISDVLNLRAWYIDRIMYVQEKKTGKYRSIELSDALYSDLLQIKQSAIRTGDKTAYIFKSRRKPTVSVHRSGYHRRLKRICKQIDIDFSAHSTRKLFAQELMRSTGDIFLVQKSLNHKFLADTCNYLDIDLPELIKKATELKQLLKN